MRCAIYRPKNNFGAGLFNFGVEVLSHISESDDKNRSSSSNNNNNNSNSNSNSSVFDNTIHRSCQRRKSMKTRDTRAASVLMVYRDEMRRAFGKVSSGMVTPEKSDQHS